MKIRMKKRLAELRMVKSEIGIDVQGFAVRRRADSE